MRTLVQRVEGPPCNDGSLITVRATKTGDDELPFTHDTFRVAHHLRWALSGQRLRELLAQKPLQEFAVAFVNTEYAPPQPRLVLADRVR